MKKMLSMLLALTLVFALAVPAGAAEKTPAAPKSSEVGVIVNGAAVTFPDKAKPELVKGNTMIPIKALVEALGGQVTMENGEIVCKFAKPSNGMTNAEVSFAPGADSYFKNGYTYVSARTFAKATGFDLLWDRTTRSAVLIDKNTLIAEIDKSFTILNAALEKQQSDPTKNYKSTMTYDIGMNMPATEYSDAMNIMLKLKLDMISSADAVEMNGSMDGSALVKLLELDKAVENDVLTAAEALAINKALTNLTFQMRFDLKTMTYYMNMPVLSVLTDGEIPAETWMKLDMSDLLSLSGQSLSGLDLNTLEQTPLTVGNLIYLMCRMNAYSNADLFNQISQTGVLMATFFGDDAAKKNGDAATFHFGKAELDKLAGEKFADELFDTFSVDLTVNGGTMTCDFNIKTVKDESGDAFAFSGKMTMSADKAAMNMLLDMGAMGKITYVLNVVMTPTTQKPQTLPPTGAKIMDLSELLDQAMDKLDTVAPALPEPAPAA